MSPAAHPALVLNADFRPLSYFPLSLWPWQDAVHAVVSERVSVVAEYDAVARSPSTEIPLPSDCGRRGALRSRGSMCSCVIASAVSIAAKSSTARTSRSITWFLDHEGE
jgi:5-methylcytosine-specific restriction endonuclease McrA